MGTLKVNGAITATDHITSGSLRVANSGDIGTYLTTTGGWARGWYYTINDTSMGGFGFYGSGSTKVNSFYVGTYSSPWMSVTPAGTVTATTFSGSLSGNASTATKLKTARTISLTGSVTGSGSFDGSGNLSIATTTNHTHSYLPLSGGNLTGHLYLTKAVSNSSTANTSQIIFGTSSNNHVAISSNTHAIIINPSANSTTGQIILSTDGVSTFTHGVNYATSAGSASSVAWSGVTGKPSSFTPASHTHSYLVSGGTASGSSHAEALKAYFTNNKASIPRNSLLNYYSSAMSNGSQYMGYFLSGYDSTPYGGFFVAHYNNPYYVGISYGSFTEQHILTSTNYSSYCIPANAYIATTTNSGGDAILKISGRTDMGCLRLTNTNWTGYGTADPASSGLTAVEGRVYFKIIG